MVTGVERRTDAELVRAAADGDEQAFAELIGRHFDAVFLAAYARLGQREAAEDLAQEVFLRAYLHLDTLVQPDRFVQWCCRVARNLASDWRRHAQTASRLTPLVPIQELSMEQLPDPTEGLREKLDREERTLALRLALDTLPDDQREIVLLHYYEGLNDRQVADRLGMHRTTVRYHLDRVLGYFRQKLEPLLGDGPAVPVRPNRAAVARAKAIVTCAMAVSASEKSALAAASGGQPSVSMSLPLFNSIKSALGAEGVIVGSGKVITAGAVAALLVIGGGVYYAGGGSAGKAESSVAATQPNGHIAAASFEGNWMGELKMSQRKPLRLVYRVNRAADGNYYGSTDSPDEKQGGVPIDQITVTGNRIRMENSIVKASYEGELQGEKIVGTLTQRGQSISLDLTRVDTAPAVAQGPPRTEVKIDPALLDRYIGEYRASADEVNIVTREGDQLMVQLTGFANTPVYPESESKFFFRAFNGGVTFENNESGNVDRLIRRLGDGERVFRKIK